VKQVAIFGGCIKDLVPDEIAADIISRVKEEGDKKLWKL
jgi:phosphopantetheine adenylyltransferase